MLTNDEYNEVYSNINWHGMSSLWQDRFNNFEENKNLTLYLIRRLLNDKKLKLAKEGKFLEGTVDDQIKLFEMAFPEEKEFNERGHYWWYTDESPANQAVWIIDQEISGFTTPIGDGTFYFWS